MLSLSLSHRPTQTHTQPLDIMPMDMCTAAARGRLDKIKALAAIDPEEPANVRWFDG